MNPLRLVPLYIGWHYTTAFVDMFNMNRNIFWFLWHFFSVPDTFKTFFTPWERMADKYKKGADIESIFTTFVANTLMRIVGMIMRTVLLFFALVSFFATIVVVFIAFIIWLFVPFILLCLAYFGITALFN